MRRTGLFSSQITSRSANEVLLAGKNCGILYTGFAEVVEDIWWKQKELIDLYLTQRSNAYISYASQCYSGLNAEQSEKCRPYVKPRLKYTLVGNASCPFDDKICRVKSANVLMESALLDSLEDFGLNTANSQRFGLRVRSQCAPIVTEGFSSIYQPKNPQYSPSLRFYYGNAIESPPNRNVSFTYQVPYNVSARSIADHTSREAANPDFAIGYVPPPYWAAVSNVTHAIAP